MSYQSNISFLSDGLTLTGRVTAPNETGTFPGVLCLHGAGKSNKDRYEFLQNYLTDCGYATMAFDFRGCGNSEGSFEDGSLNNRLTDALNAYTYFSKHTTHNPQLTTIIGSSMGGHIACRLTQAHPVSSLILLAAAAYGPQTESLPLDAAFTAAIRKDKSWEDSLSFAALDTFRGNICTIYGEAEEVIPKDIQMKYQSYAKKQGMNYTIRGTGHALLTADTRITQELSNVIGKFLKTT